MKSAKSWFSNVLVVCVIIIAAIPVSAQEWSAKQKEVWKNVQQYWDLDAKQDLVGFMSYFHEDYLGWSKRSAFPGNKAMVRKWVGESYKNSKTIIIDLSPLAINIFNDVAIVHYYYSQLTENKEGKRKPEQGRWTDILMKQGDKWVLIGDQGGMDQSSGSN
jgi:ketosteroid isomerase-like protein